MKRFIAGGAALAAVGLTVVALAGPSGASFDDLKISAEGEAFALRVEYDFPLPAGTGTIAHVVGEARRSAGENAHGQVGAPDKMDLVVGGTVAKPHDKFQSLPEPYPLSNRLPETECFYPGALASTHTLYPTDMRPEVSAAPPIATAIANCQAGPVADLHATSVSFGAPNTPTASLGAIVRSGALAADGLMRPIEGVVRSDVAARAEGVSLLNGVITIGAVIADSSSSARGEKGSAASTSRIAVNDVVAAGQRFSIASDKLIIGGTSVPLASDQADAFFKTLNASLKPQGCSIAALTTPAKYPQAFVFHRPEPVIEVKADGTYAASVRAGLLVLCDLPESITGQTTFSPQQIQAVIGFAYSKVEALDQPGGFNLGNLGGFTGGAFIDVPPLTISVPLPSIVAGASLTPLDLSTPASAPAPAPTPVVSRPRTRTIATFHPLGDSTRWALLALGALLFAALTHVGIVRLRRVFAA